MATYNYNQNPYYYYPPTYQQLQNGRLVESAEAAQTADVPVGGYGVFPKADFTEVYIKTWNSNGTTNFLTYKLANGSPESPQNDLTQINNKLASLEEKLDTFIASNSRGVNVHEY